MQPNILTFLETKKGGCVLRAAFTQIRAVSWFGSVVAFPNGLNIGKLAESILTGLRYETDQGKFDAREYRSDRPMAFDILAEKYLNRKEKTVKPKVV